MVRGGAATTPARPASRSRGARAARAGWKRTYGHASLRDVYLLFRARVSHEDCERADAHHHEADYREQEAAREAGVRALHEVKELVDGEAERGNRYYHKQNVN